MTPAIAAYVGLLLARVGTFVAVMPPFAARTPRTVRAAFAIALTAFYLAAAPPTWDGDFAKTAGDVDPLRYALALVREALIGASMGFVFALFLLPARIAGEFVTQQIGLNASQAQSPSGAEGGGPFTIIFETTAGLLFLGVDGHHLAITALHASFAKFPLGGPGLPEFGPHLAALSTAYEAGMLLAGPLALCLFLLSVCLAIMTRVAPQLNVYSIGFTIQTIVALLGVLFLLPEIVRGLAFAGAANVDAANFLVR
ncbi:flagellar biosynthetic protein FliR [Limnoglobus roseus]|uniref:Type III secretion protein n=1 Tax=Limnoglobus roseus TaxID=2598579 RepID=A0A5C1A2H4_9BACT|nr:flagellar biosynthetic protein FliR [Limnoglobus roseus]QEL13319.1 type III secretion protein [Limnoglobus roseus]